MDVIICKQITLQNQNKKNLNPLFYNDLLPRTGQSNLKSAALEGRYLEKQFCNEFCQLSSNL